MNKSNKRTSTTLGILAHVDAGKTTLTEGLLYVAGATSRVGRVDNRDAYLDTHVIERERGITVFSKQALIETEGRRVTLIDTPGHVDFSCEAERALSVQDYAMLVISGAEGVTAHTKTLWHLLASRHIPTFIFVNKTDIADRRREDMLAEIRTVLSAGAVDFTQDGSAEFFETAAGADTALIEEFFDTERLSQESIIRAVKRRRIFPVYFGSALKMKGVSELLAGFIKYSAPPNYSDTHFGAKIYKVNRDKAGKRLTYMKITGGVLRPKDTVAMRDFSGNTITEKVEEIRLYSGDKYKSATEARAGDVVAVTGLASSRVGGGVGFEADDSLSITPVLDYKIALPLGVDPQEAYLKLIALTEEDPSLGLTYSAGAKEIRVKLMGEIQKEVLGRIILDRFGMAVEFDEGAVLLKETVAEPVRGAGHFEPLRHYAEVHLLIEPLPAGSGICVGSDCPTDTLALNWQRLIMTHIEERVHRGVLTGSPLTDVSITLTAGKAHLKHTEGGDFRQATYRAIRQALRKARSVLLEPTFDFKITLPKSNLGRAMNDITTSLAGRIDRTDIIDDVAEIEGNAPVAKMRSYPAVIRAYTSGAGRITMMPAEYAPCHNADEVIEKMGYDPDLDERNTADSVFCKGGSGYAVPWYEADDMMHVSPMGVRRDLTDIVDSGEMPDRARSTGGFKSEYERAEYEDKELMRIFESTYGKIKQRKVYEKIENSASDAKKEKPRKSKGRRGADYLIIDGYNLIFAWDELKRIADSDLALARDKLIIKACNYAAVRKCRVLVVFDAYKREENEGSEEQIGTVTVVYTKTRETADTYIERMTYDIADDNYVRVVSSDMQEQFIILGNGAYRMSPREFIEECTAVDMIISSGGSALRSSD